MKRTYARLIALLLLLTVLFLPVVTSCSGDEKKGTQPATEAPTEAPTEEPTEEPTEAPTEEPTEEPTEAPTEEPTEEPTEAPTEEPTTILQDDEVRLPYLNKVKSLYENGFDVYSTTTEVTLTRNDGLVLHASYEIRKSQITYTQEYLKEFIIGADDDEPIGVRQGTIKSTTTQYEQMTFSDLTLDPEDFVNYYGEKKGGVSYLTVIFRDDALTRAFGIDFEGATNVTMVFAYNSNAITRIEISYDLPDATVTAINVITAN